MFMQLYALLCSKFSHVRLAEIIRRSQYIELAVAPLELACHDTDGECTSMPIVFEDRYVGDSPVGRRRNAVHVL